MQLSEFHFEWQSDMYFSTLPMGVVGRELEITVKLPAKPIGTV